MLRIEPCCIIAIKYTEPEWIETKTLVEQCGVPIIYVDRNGTGPLAAAYNRGFRKLGNFGLSDVPYIWFVSNVTFDPDIMMKLVKRMNRRSDYAAIHPSFENSDHMFCRPNGKKKVEDVPFIEFTAPIVRKDVYEKHMLDENMPYWGHDLDWGYRVRQSGYKIGVDHRNQIYHTYNRDLSNEHLDTVRRRENRQKTDSSTSRHLMKKYGYSWRGVVGYHG